jgi:methyltransferase
MIFAVIVLQRFAELTLARRNEAWLRARGAYEAGRKAYKYLVMMHVLFFIALPAEVLLFIRSRPAWWWLPLSMIVFAQALRFWSIATLGKQWTTRIIVLPGAPMITTGPYRYLRHPSYFAAGLELLSLPLMFGAYYTAIVFSVLNVAMMSIRIPAERRALLQQAAKAEE